MRGIYPELVQQKAGKQLLAVILLFMNYTFLQGSDPFVRKARPNLLVIILTRRIMNIQSMTINLK